MSRFNAAVLVIAIALFPSLLFATQGSLNNSGGSTSVSTGVNITSSVSSPAGTLTINCPAAGSGGCTGGSLTFLSTDGTTNLSTTFTTGSAIESCSGGGRGGHISCGYTVSGNVSGTLTVSGATQAVLGVTSQTFPVGGSATGTSAYNSAYSPFYYSDSEQILRSDDLKGTNQITYGSQGGGVGNFYGAYGLALDSSGRIYVADTYNCRVTRMDDMNGTNWTTYGGTCGSAAGQFYDPQGIAVDSLDRIYIMDTGNSRFVRIDNMTGANWTTFGTVGSGVNQFLSYTGVTIDSANHIYVPDSGNRRIVRFDDMIGTNWTVLSQSPPVNGFSYTFASPVAVALDAAGRLYVADDGSVAPEVIRVNDMTGAGWTSIYVAPTGSTGLNSISTDSSGAAYTGGGGVRIIDNMAGYLLSSGNVAPYGTYYVFGVTPVPSPSWPPSAVGLNPPTLSFSSNVGVQSSPQSVTISNFGGAPLNLSSIAASAGFGETNTCPPQIAAGSSCTVQVTFTPASVGQANGTLTVTDDSANAGSTQTVALSGTGLGPIASVSPTSLTFSSQPVGSTSAAQNVTLQNTGTGPMSITSISASASFTQNNNCGSSLAAGGSCIIAVSFAPIAMGSASGTLTINDNAGTQTVSLSGTGTAPVTLSTASLNFGKVTVGKTSAALTVTLKNHMSGNLTFSSITATAPFAVSSNTCGEEIGGGATCSVSVTFKPTARTSYSGTLTFTDSAVNSPQVVTLSGSGR